jgi:hypothetical protein
MRLIPVVTTAILLEGITKKPTDAEERRRLRHEEGRCVAYAG